MPNLEELASRVEALHDRLARSHPSLERGRVWCRQCGDSQSVSSAFALRYGWPKCCGATMTIDSPEEQAALRSRALLSKGEKGE